MNIMELKSLLYMSATRNTIHNTFLCKHPASRRWSRKQGAEELKRSSWRDRFRGNFARSSAIFATASAILLTPGPAQAISGGVKGVQPWVVQVIAPEGEGAETCTGSALNAEWVLTAKHCLAKEVYYPDGTTVNVHSIYPVADVDSQILVLDHEHPLSKYPLIGPDYLATGHVLPSGTLLHTYGYGRNYHSQQKRLNLKLVHHGLLNIDKAPIEGFHVSGTNGMTENGDSGGPLMVNNFLIGILHAKGQSFDDQDILVFHGLSKVNSAIRQYQHSREMRSISEVDSAIPWISSVTVQNGKLTLIADANFAFYSGRDIRFWVNGKYAGNIKKFSCFYCDASYFKNSPATIKPGEQVRLGDLVQIGIASGANNTPDTADLLYETTINGIEDVTIKDGRYDIRVSSELMNSGHRLIFWLNGAYAAEVFNGSTYYASVDQVPGGTIVHTGPATAKRILQIAVVPGSPGMDIATPAKATKMLYSNAPMK